MSDKEFISLEELSPCKQVVSEAKAICSKAVSLLDKIEDAPAYTQTEAFLRLVNQSGGLNLFLARLKINKQQHKELMHEVQSVMRKQLETKGISGESSKVVRKTHTTPKKRVHL